MVFHAMHDNSIDYCDVWTQFSEVAIIIVRSVYSIEWDKYNVLSWVSSINIRNGLQCHVGFIL